MDVKDLKLRIINAGLKAVEELIKVAKEDIIKINPEDDLSADKLKNAAATKKLAIFDAFEILSRVESEREALEAIDKGISKTDTKQGFAERRSK
jgi:hypothetical protein